MAKFTDAWRVALQNYFNSGDQPTEAQFTQLMISIQQGIEEHDHDGTGDGDGIASIGITGITGAGTDVPNGWYLGIGAALERIVFDAAGDICVMGAKFGVGTLTPVQDVDLYRSAANAIIRAKQTGAGNFYAGFMADGDDAQVNLSAYDDAYADVAEYAGKCVFQAGNANLALVAMDATVGEIQMYAGGRAVANKRLVVTKDGLVGVSNATPGAILDSAVIARFQVGGDTDESIYMSLKGGANDEAMLAVENDARCYRFGILGGDTWALYDETADALRIVVSVAGAMQWPAYGAGDLQTDATGNITAVSDARLKEQVRNTEIGLAEVLRMQGKAWHYTKKSGLDTEHEYLGFIADDIEKVVPGAVGRMQDGMRTLSTTSLLPAFAKAIQELDARLTQGGL